MPKNITIFTTNQCSSCATIKHYLASKGLAYEEVNVDEHPQRREEAKQLSGMSTVPITVVTKPDDSRDVIVGVNLAKLVPAITA